MCPQNPVSVEEQVAGQDGPEVVFVREVRRPPPP
ncbi:unnamed protein product, partial [Allacma fusca]